jgi:sphingomyelin phosphodiesterase acid-like 3
MLWNLTAGIRRGFALCCAAGLCLGARASAARPQRARAGQAPVRVLMISDIHFDPFGDPAKVEQLAAAPAGKWAAILSAAPAPDREERAAALNKTCDVRGSDTDYPLFTSSLRAMKDNAAGARFITVSGDLLAHGFSCKYNATVAHGTAAGYADFATKTLEFVMEELRSAFPDVPVYAALGNNDSGCGDYQLDAGGAFLRDITPALTADIPKAEQPQARRDIMAGGDYSVALPTPMERARLLVVNDVFMSPNYATCGGKPDPAPAAKQIAWLRSRLQQARRNHEKVWVMAHIPPGIDPYSTIKKMANVCAGAAPVTFLDSAELADAIAEFGDVVRLAVFAHTHMDELRLLRVSKSGAGRKPVAMKIVPSISPVDGNNPSFVVAGVNAASAILMDYRVIAATNQPGVDAQWREEYDFDRAYGETAFSAADVERLIAAFRADGPARTAASQEYLRNYYVGDRSAALKFFWPEYTCTLANDTAEGFRSCMCSDVEEH